ncbi:MAG: isoamylase early set domain-containing protein [Phycisphaerae bacterium]
MVHVDETGKTTFRFRHRTEGPVFLVGDFCSWQTDHLPMRRTDDGDWILMLRLPPGTYEFRYLAGGRWFTDYAAFGIVQNAFGDWNAVVRVPKVQAARAPRFPLPGSARRRLARSA